MGCPYYPESRHRSAYAGDCDVKEVGVRSGYNNFLYARAATWVDGAMLRADQQPLPQTADAKNSVAAVLRLEYNAARRVQQRKGRELKKPLHSNHREK
jgi:hypothetical protein